MVTKEMLLPEKRPSNREACPDGSRLYSGERAAGIPPVVSFVGNSNSGKTMLLEKVIRELKAISCRVAVIKHSHHDFQADRPGKDSWRFAQAGSDAVVLSSPNRIAMVQQVDEELSMSHITAWFVGKMDIILTEGYKKGAAAKILVTGAELNPVSFPLPEEPLATVVPYWSSTGELEFADGDVNNVVSLLTRLMDENSADKFDPDGQEENRTPDQALPVRR